MARQNHNANYLYDVDGETVWEKLRTIRGMLDDRRRAYQLAILSKEENEEKFKEDNASIEYKKWLINKDFQDGLIQDCKNEIKFLEEFESYLSAESEKTRIAGKTDDEMYEINFFHEMEVRLVRRVQAQIASCGRINDETILRLMKNKGALKLCIQQGLMPAEITNLFDTPLLPSPDVHTVLFLENKKEETND